MEGLLSGRAVGAVLPGQLVDVVESTLVEVTGVIASSIATEVAAGNKRFTCTWLQWLAQL